MACNTNCRVPDEILDQALLRAYQGQFEDAHQLLEPFGLSEEQRAATQRIFQNCQEDPSKARDLKERLVQVISTGDVAIVALPEGVNNGSALGLSQDILLHFDLDIRSLMACRQVSQTWHSITQGEGFWQALCSHDFGQDLSKINHTQSFSKIYQDCHLSEMNLRKGRFCRSICPIRLRSNGSGPKGASGLVFHNGKLVMNRNEMGIAIVDLETNATMTLSEVTDLSNFSDLSDQVTCSEGKLLVSDEDNRTVTIWDIQTGKRCKTLREENRHVMTYPVVFDGKLFGGVMSDDQTQTLIEVWNIETGEQLDSLQEDLLCCSPVVASNGKLFACGRDQVTIKMWVLSSGECQDIPTGGQTIQFLAVSNGQLIVGCWNGAIKILDIETGKWSLPLVSKPSESRMCSLTVAHGKLFVSYGSTIRIFDIASGGDCISTLPIGPFGRSGKYYKSWIPCVTNHHLFLESEFELEILDFTKDTHAILANMAEEWESESADEMSMSSLCGMPSCDKWEMKVLQERFCAMPEQVKNQIYEELYHILKPWVHDYWRCGEYAFLGQNSLSSTPEQKAQAIRSYCHKRYGSKE